MMYISADVPAEFAGEVQKLLIGAISLARSIETNLVIMDLVKSLQYEMERHGKSTKVVAVKTREEKDKASGWPLSDDVPGPDIDR
jgi:hypothetical protein